MSSAPQFIRSRYHLFFFAGLLSICLPGLADDPIPETERAQIDAAIPTTARIQPRRPRRLLVFDLNINYSGHRSAAHANYAITRMGEQTGAYETVVSNDPQMFRPETLRQFDAVFFNNNVGNLFEDSELRESLAQFVYSGGGMLGVHGATVAFTHWPGAREDWPEFGRMIGARGASHRDNKEPVVVKLDDPSHRLNIPFNGQSFDYRDEFFRVHEPYSRDRLRILLSIDTDRTDFSSGGPLRGKQLRTDNDYALSWIRSYGRGRVFYCTIAHNPYVFWDPRMLEFYLGAIQFALGDLKVGTTPSARLSPETRALEDWEWRLEACGETVRTASLFESIELAAASNAPHIGAFDSQQISPDSKTVINETLTAEQLQAIRLKLDDAGVRLLTYSIKKFPIEEQAVRRMLEFTRTLGAELLLVESWPDSSRSFANLTQEYGLVAASPAQLHSDLPDGSPSATSIATIHTLADLPADKDNLVDLTKGLGEETTIVFDLPVSLGALNDAAARDRERLTFLQQHLSKSPVKPIVFRIRYPKLAPSTSQELDRAVKRFYDAAKVTSEVIHSK